MDPLSGDWCPMRDRMPAPLRQLLPDWVFRVPVRRLCDPTPTPTGEPPWLDSRAAQIPKEVKK